MTTGTMTNCDVPGPGTTWDGCTLLVDAPPTKKPKVAIMIRA
jgi:hypothetical protein